MAEAEDALKRVFGFTGFRPGQQEILEAVFAGEHVLAVMPTGSGKSLCYQLPAIVRKGLTIVVSPLIALMRDQVQQLRARGIAASALNSSNTSEDNAAIEAALRAKRCRLLYVAPERLVRPEMAGLLREAGANVFAIDEAHCVSQWGHDFRPEYLCLEHVARAIGGLQIIAVTAAADAAARREIVKKLFPAEPRIFVRSFDRPNIHLAIKRKRDPARQIEAMVKRHKGSSGIIYCASRKGAEKLSEYLSRAGVPALPYHAGLDPADRSAHEDEFLRHDGVVIVATIAFGMGIDKPNVRFVCHADLPHSVESYYQEIGRGGRDGLPAETLTLFSDSDIHLRKRQIDASGAPFTWKQAERRRLDALAALCETPRCRRQTLLAAFGEESEPCGNCDICDGKGVFPAGAMAVRKAISAASRAPERVLTGQFAAFLSKGVPAVIRHGVNHWLGSGAGGEAGSGGWRSILSRLQGAGLMAQEPEDHGRSAVTGAGRGRLMGNGSLPLNSGENWGQGSEGGVMQWLDAIEETQPDSDPSWAESYAPPEGEAANRALTARQSCLFAALKAARLEAARRHKLPPYTVFDDSVLLEMALRRPATEGELLGIPGVEAAAAKRFGAAFLAVIAKESSDW
jgi:ATP-dependent DNA helicase RecQ